MPESVTPRILIVEDSISSAFLYEAQITRRKPDFSVDIKRDMKSCKMACLEFKPHIILLDLHLPDTTTIDGKPSSVLDIKVLKEGFGDFKGACIIAMSADVALGQMSLDEGADDFMPKAAGEDSAKIVKRITDLIPKCVCPSC